ncbi:hypothetical protein ACJJTC_013173 [Scirpophaga incertulas]
MSVESAELAKIVALNSPAEETTANLDDVNTQAILEVEDPPHEVKKRVKGKMLVSTQKKRIRNSPLIKWLENFWQATVTLRVMKQFLKNINEQSLLTKNMQLFNVGQALQRKQKELEGQESDMEGSIMCQESSSYPNMDSTCMSSMTVPTLVQRAVASISRELKTIYTQGDNQDEDSRWRTWKDGDIPEGEVSVAEALQNPRNSTGRKRR